MILHKISPLPTKGDSLQASNNNAKEPGKYQLTLHSLWKKPQIDDIMLQCKNTCLKWNPARSNNALPTSSSSKSHSNQTFRSSFIIGKLYHPMWVKQSLPLNTNFQKTEQLSPSSLSVLVALYYLS